ncbi:hypothetical protein BOX15_Mlig017546g1 [Macrostomum lignano]|uniref:Uncharacterized protein n=1 Tax=Macrostomum lignano TaxID=282301 RepID=A0A267DQ40_9PLAT|nr:hypothetical protein BOX15_Mlig017546g1 [Macrostomum lignano]
MSLTKIYKSAALSDRRAPSLSPPAASLGRIRSLPPPLLSLMPGPRPQSLPPLPKLRSSTPIRSLLAAATPTLTTTTKTLLLLMAMKLHRQQLRRGPPLQLRSLPDVAFNVATETDAAAAAAACSSASRLGHPAAGSRARICRQAASLAASERRCNDPSRGGRRWIANPHRRSAGNRRRRRRRQVVRWWKWQRRPTVGHPDACAVSTETVTLSVQLASLKAAAAAAAAAAALPDIVSQSAQGQPSSWAAHRCY